MLTANVTITAGFLKLLYSFKYILTLTIQNVFLKRAATGTVILWDWETSQQAKCLFVYTKALLAGIIRNS